MYHKKIKYHLLEEEKKGILTQNIMAACNFDMQFIFVWAGWEGSTQYKNFS
jgi:hypothetical protein